MPGWQIVIDGDPVQRVFKDYKAFRAAIELGCKQGIFPPDADIRVRRWPEDTPEPEPYVPPVKPAHNWHWLKIVGLWVAFWFIGYLFLKLKHMG